MKVLVVIGHQREGSFCHAIAEAARAELQAAGHDVIYHDLYAEHFDPILPDEEIPKGAVPAPLIEQHNVEVRAADGYIVVHPNWWAMPPAILKGWIDRVFRQGVTYEFGPNGVVGHLRGRRRSSSRRRTRRATSSWNGSAIRWRTCGRTVCSVSAAWRKKGFTAATSSRSSSARPSSAASGWPTSGSWCGSISRPRIDTKTIVAFRSAKVAPLSRSERRLYDT